MADHISDAFPNVNVTKPEVVNNVNVNQVRSIATKLVTVLGDDQSLDFYLKVGWNLPESFIWKQLEIAQTKRKPAAYFSAVCKANIR